jgi:TonB family protein
MLMGVAVPRLLMGKLQLASLLLPILLATPSGAQSDSANEWRQKIIGQLMPHFQVSTRLYGRTGEAWVDFTIDRSGFVKSTKLVRSTGIPEVDSAAVAAIEAAQPLSVPPAGVDDSGLKIRGVFVLPPPTSSTRALNDEQLKARLRGICRGC